VRRLASARAGVSVIQPRGGRARRGYARAVAGIGYLLPRQPAQTPSAPTRARAAGRSYLACHALTYLHHDVRAGASIDRRLGMSRNGPASHRPVPGTSGGPQGRSEIGGASLGERVPTVADDGRHTVRRQIGSQRTDDSSPPFRRCLLPNVGPESAPASGSNDAPPTWPCAVTLDSASRTGYRASPVTDETEPVRLVYIADLRPPALPPPN